MWVLGALVCLLHTCVSKTSADLKNSHGPNALEHPTCLWGQWQSKSAPSDVLMRCRVPGPYHDGACEPWGIGSQATHTHQNPSHKEPVTRGTIRLQKCGMTHSARNKAASGTSWRGMQHPVAHAMPRPCSGSAMCHHSLGCRLSGDTLQRVLLEDPCTVCVAAKGERHPGTPMQGAPNVSIVAPCPLPLRIRKRFNHLSHHTAGTRMGAQAMHCGDHSCPAGERMAGTRSGRPTQLGLQSIKAAACHLGMTPCHRVAQNSRSVSQPFGRAAHNMQGADSGITGAGCP